MTVLFSVYDIYMPMLCLWHTRVLFSPCKLSEADIYMAYRKILFV